MAPWGKCVTLSNLIPITNHSDDLGVFFFHACCVKQHCGLLLLKQEAGTFLVCYVAQILLGFNNKNLGSDSGGES